MRIAGGVLGNQADGLEHLEYLLLNQLLILNALDLKSLGYYLLDRHTGVKGGDRVLIDHLDLGNKILFRVLVVVLCLGDLGSELGYSLVDLRLPRGISGFSLGAESLELGDV